MSANSAVSFFIFFKQVPWWDQNTNVLGDRVQKWYLSDINGLLLTFVNVSEFLWHKEHCVVKHRSSFNDKTLDALPEH